MTSWKKKYNRTKHEIGNFKTTIERDLSNEYSDHDYMVATKKWTEIKATIAQLINDAEDANQKSMVTDLKKTFDALSGNLAWETLQRKHH